MIRRPYFWHKRAVEEARVSDALDEVFHEAYTAMLAGYDENGDWHPHIDGCDRMFLERMGIRWD